MTKAEYMKKLQEKLERFGQELQEEILEDYRQHFAEGENEGKSEEEIIEELGNIEEMIRELSEEDLPEEFAQKNQEAAGQMQPGEGAENAEDYANVEANRRFSYSGLYKAVVLDGKLANLYVEPSDNDQIHVDYVAKGINNQMNYEFYQYEEDGVFHAGVKHRKGMKDNGGDEEKLVKVTLFGRTIISYGTISNFESAGQNITLTVKMPKGIAKLVTKSTSGNVHIAGLELETLESACGSGNISLEDMVVDRISAHTGSGNVSANRTEFFSASMEAGSGNLKAEGVKGRELRCSVGSGNIRVDSTMSVCHLQAGSGNVRVRAVKESEKLCLSTGSGSIRLEMEETTGMEARVKSGSGSIHIAWDGEESQKVKPGTYTYGDGTCKVEATTGSGSIRISRN